MMASIARRYARAMLEIAADANTVDDLEGGSTFRRSRGRCTSPPSCGLLSNPAFSREARQRSFAAIAAALGLPPAVTNLVRVLIDRDRAGELPQNRPHLSRAE